MPVIPALTLVAGSLRAPPAQVQTAPIAQQVPHRYHTTARADNGSVLDLTFGHVANKGGLLVFTGGVEVKLDLTALRTDTLTVDEVKKTAVAPGLTIIDDPEAQISCTDFAINYADKTGHGNNFLLRASGVVITAKSVDIKPGHWTAYSVTGTTSRRNPPTYQVKADSIDVYPGQSGVARHIMGEFGGLNLGPLPRATFNLDTRVTGLQIPDITNRRDEGIGVGWASEVLVDKHTAALASFGAFPHVSTSYGLEIARSSLDPATSGAAIVPRSDLSEYVADGYFDNIFVRTTEEETGLLHSRRSNFGVGMTYNVGSNGRMNDSKDISKMAEIATEQGGPVGPFGVQTSARLERIRDSSAAPWVNRANAQATVALPHLRLAKGLFIDTRADMSATVSSNGQFGFSRIESGLVYRPIEGVSLGLAGAWGRNFGSSDFAFDPLPHEKDYMIRADYRRGFLTFRYLWKYDPDIRSWYDREYELAIVADGFEPFISSRSFPTDFRVGIRFRMDNFIDKLLNRNIGRDPKIAKQKQAADDEVGH